ncbi:MAG TPA: BTAD domain-containing putative transcriptional regulator, partial [Longimicrobiaceae bacterium]|nr:BTAD domain-containing putative transcriptional regulator [Longimicrobiaceae bacterium]
MQTPASSIILQILGGVALSRADGVEIQSVLAQPKRLALLSYLALSSTRGRSSRDELLGLFWPESDEGRARGALRNGLYYLRRSLGEGVIETTGDGVGLSQAALWCDAVAFQEAVRDGRLEEALALYRGPLLPGLCVDGAPGWDDWLDRERSRFARAAADAARALRERAEAAGEIREAAQWGRRMVELAPGEEEPVRHLMGLLARLGDGAAALRCYDELSRRLEQELGIQPSEKTRRVAEALRRDAGASEAGLPEPPPDASALPPPMEVEARSDPAAPLSPARAARRGAWAVVLGAGILIVLAVALRRGVHGDLVSPTAASTGAAERVAVLPFSVRGYTRYDYLGEGMVDLLSADLDGAGELRAVDPRAVLGTMPAREREIGPAEGRRAAERLGAQLY